MKNVYPEKNSEKHSEKKCEKSVPGKRVVKIKWKKCTWKKNNETNSEKSVPGKQIVKQIVEEVHREKHSEKNVPGKNVNFTCAIDVSCAGDMCYSLRPG